MITQALLTELSRTAEEYPYGAVVWHKANAVRGIVVGYTVCARSIMVNVSYGPGSDLGQELPCELTANKPAEDCDGEDWKQTH